jgi:hypothetical protein
MTALNSGERLTISQPVKIDGGFSEFESKNNFTLDDVFAFRFTFDYYYNSDATLGIQLPLQSKPSYTNEQFFVPVLTTSTGYAASFSIPIPSDTLMNVPSGWEVYDEVVYISRNKLGAHDADGKYNIHIGFELQAYSGFIVHIDNLSLQVAISY